MAPKLQFRCEYYLHQKKAVCGFKTASEAAFRTHCKTHQMSDERITNLVTDITHPPQLLEGRVKIKEGAYRRLDQVFQPRVTAKTSGAEIVEVASSQGSSSLVSSEPLSAGENQGSERTASVQQVGQASASSSDGGAGLGTTAAVGKPSSTGASASTSARKPRGTRKQAEKGAGQHYLVSLMGFKEGDDPIQCPMCGSGPALDPFTMYHHILRAHVGTFDVALLDSSPMRELHNKVRRQRYREARQVPQLSQDELSLMEPGAPGVIRCTACTRDLAVMSVAGHFKSKAHRFEQARVEKWYCHMHKRASHVWHSWNKAWRLGHGMSQTPEAPAAPTSQPPEAPAAPIGSTVAVIAQGSSHQSGVGGGDCQGAVALCEPTGLVQHGPVDSGTPASQVGAYLSAVCERITGIEGKIDRLADPLAAECGEMNIVMKAQWATWKYEGDKKVRYTCPVVPSRRPRMEPFQAYCKHFTPNAKSVLYSVQAVHRMIEMFDISTGRGTAAHPDKEWAYLIAAMCSAYKSGVFRSFFSCEIMKPCYGWAREIHRALVLLLPFLRRVCGEYGWPKCKGIFRSIEEEVMADFGQEVVRARQLLNFNKKMRDDDATQTLPSIPEIQGQVFQAMCDLITLAAGIKVGTVEVTSEVRAAASAILAIILLLNGYFGRSGEWNIMKIDWVLAQIRSGKDWLKITWHKTILTSGVLCKWLAPGTIEAIKLFSEMRLHENSEYLFPLARGGSGVPNVHTLLRRASAMYFPKRTAPKVNLIRKYFHNIAEAIDCQEATAFKDQCDADGHTEPTGRFVYATGNEQNLRQKNRVAFLRAMQKPVDFPECAPHDKIRPIKQILKIPRSTEGLPLERDENDSDSDVEHEINLDVDDDDELDPSYQIVNFDEEYAKAAALSKQTGLSFKKAALFLKGRGAKGKEKPKKKHKRRSARRVRSKKTKTFVNTGESEADYFGISVAAPDVKSAAASSSQSFTEGATKRKNDDRDGSASAPGETTQPMRGQSFTEGATKRKSGDRDGSASTPGGTTQPMHGGQSQSTAASQDSDSQSSRLKKVPRRWTPAEKEVMNQWWLARTGSKDILPYRPDTEAMYDDFVAKGQIGADAIKKSVYTFFVAERERHLKLKAEAEADARAAEKREEAKRKKRENYRKKRLGSVMDIGDID
jgi:hypothetical protein